MTLIVGMDCRDSLLFCADSEESTELVGKRSVSKIHDAYGEKWSMVIATAGHGPLSDVAAMRLIAEAKLADDFHSSPMRTIQASLTAHYDQYVFSRDERRQRDRDISLIIGVVDNENSRKYLFKTFEEIVKPEAHYACAGMGVDIAYYFLDRLHDYDLTGDEATVLLAFILREAKASVDKVGKESEFLQVMFSGKYKGIHSRMRFGQVTDSHEIPQLNDCIKPFWTK